MKFIPLSYFINEAEDIEPRYGCVMLFAKIPDWNKLIHRLVRVEDIYDDETGDYGFEEDPHITLLYGIHDDKLIDKSIIYNKIENISEMKIIVKEINIFSNDDSPYDVVKFDITPTKKLLSLRKEFEEDLPNTQSFPDYHPHVTIAYVKKGKGNKYKRILKKGIKFTFDRGVYSTPDYRKIYIDLKKSAYKK
jgi:2'-5' RNA ligase